VAFVEVGSGRVADVDAGHPKDPVVALAAAADGSALYLVRDRTRTEVWLMTLR
jgi:hypothetical protein